MRDRGAYLDTIPGRHAGLKQAGNINLRGRMVVHNNDGSVSTERSFSIGTNHGETLIPQIVHGKFVSRQAAIKHYQKTGEHLGVFASVNAANSYAEKLHQHQAKAYAPKHRSTIAKMALGKA